MRHIFFRFFASLLFALPVSAQDSTPSQAITALEARIAELETLNAELINRLLDLEATKNGLLTDQVRAALMDDPSMIFDAVEEFERQQIAMQADIYADDLNGDPFLPVLGNPDGDITLVEFFDYNCGYCRRAMDDVLSLVESDGNIRLILKELPILSEHSQTASLNALAAAQDVDYLALHRAAMLSNGTVDGQIVAQIAGELGADVEALQARLERNQDSYLSALSRTRDLAQALGISGTPAFYIEGEVIPGAVSREELARRIADIRAARGADS